MNHLDPKRLAAVKTIIVHGGACPDGIASAILLHEALPAAEVKFIQYSSPEHVSLEPAPNTLFCDITPSSSVDAWVKEGAIVLDHHKTAKSIVEAFETNGRFGDEKTEPGVCGAFLAYQYVWQARRTLAGLASLDDDNNAQYFARLAGVRDTWLTNHAEWADAVVQAEMLRFYPESYWLDLKNPFGHAQQEVWLERRKIGKILVEKHAKSVERALEKCWRFTSSKGTRVLMFEGTSMSSDAAESVDKGADIVIGFGFTVENGTKKMILSTRSHTGYDVSALAKNFGGGGHTAAAGFTMEIPTINPYQFAEALVNDYEGKQAQEARDK
jgi:oligoribonuclease NrnB/cAMP/cGMP phosphodiesterase (DHH superfamily)